MPEDEKKIVAVTGTQPIEEPVPDEGAGAPAAEETDGAPQGDVLTSDAVQKMIADALAANNAQWQRVVQSSVDKRAAGLTREMQAQIKQAREQAAQVAELAKALGLDEKQAGALRDGFMAKRVEATSQLDDGEDGQGAPAEISPEQVTDYGRALAGPELYDLSADDPEVEAIQTRAGADVYLESIRLAGTKKMIRRGLEELLAELEGEEEEKPAPKAARVPGLTAQGSRAPVNPIKDINDPSALYKLATKRV